MSGDISRIWLPRPIQSGRRVQTKPQVLMKGNGYEKVADCGSFFGIRTSPGRASKARSAINLGAPRLRAEPCVPVPSGLSGRHRGPDHDRGNSAAYLLLYFHENPKSRTITVRPGARAPRRPCARPSRPSRPPQTTSSTALSEARPLFDTNLFAALAVLRSSRRTIQRRRSHPHRSRRG
jgi:hypothetical protein